MSSRLVCAALLAALAGCSPALIPLGSSAATAGAAPRAVIVDSSAALPHGDGVREVPVNSAVDVDISSEEVAREASAVFGEEVPRSALEDGGDGEVGISPLWDIDVHSFQEQDRVERWVRVFTGGARESFAAQLRRGVPYEPMMRAKLRAGGIPEDMVYLALIESGFNTHAYSRAAAVGMWQFMSSTARGVGLRVDWWIDERRDPIRATDAAVSFLNDLRKQFGSLYLAAAAYNGGPGRVARGLVRYADDLEGSTGDSLFFALAETDALRAETRDYVPKLIAAALVAKEPERYGIRVDPAPPFAYDSVMVPGNTALGAVARASGVPLAEVRALNPHILRGMTPRGATPMRVRVPTGASKTFNASFASLADSQRIGVRRVVSKKGDTYVSIARREAKGRQLTARVFGSYNPLLKPNSKGVLSTGSVVWVPAADAVAAAHDVPDPKIERYPPRAGSAFTHVVRPGESLSVIAARYGTSVSTLQRLNGLKTTLIRPGQKLVVRAAPAAVKKKTPAKKPVSASKRSLSRSSSS